MAAESGDAKLLGNFSKLIEFVSVNPDYNPAKASLKVPALNAQKAAAVGAVADIGAQRAPYKSAVNERLRGFEGIGPIVLDQADPDSGTCWECGYAYKLGCPVLGLRTDIRTTGDAPGASVNLMLPQSCREFLQVPLDKREDVTWVAARVGEGIERILKRTTS